MDSPVEPMPDRVRVLPHGPLARHQRPCPRWGSCAPVHPLHHRVDSDSEATKSEGGFPGYVERGCGLPAEEVLLNTAMVLVPTFADPLRRRPIAKGMLIALSESALLLLSLWMNAHAPI